MRSDADAVGADTVGGDAVAEEVDDDEITANDVDDLFARLRSANEETPAEGSADAEAELPATPTAFEQRDEALTPLIVSSGRTLKRVLADEQNDVLDRLRGKQSVRAIDDLLPAAEEQTARYFDALASDLRAAAAAGASAVGTSDDAATLDDDDVVGVVRDALRDDLVAPLRDRLATSIEAVDGDNEDLTKKARAIYREWKTKRIDDQLDDLLRQAYSRGALHAACRRPAGPLDVRSDRSGRARNARTTRCKAPIAAGTAFPTGHVCAPAHTGCRCLVIPVD